jgi:hypothetical protein
MSDEKIMNQINKKTDEVPQIKESAWRLRDCLLSAIFSLVWSVSNKKMCDAGVDPNSIVAGGSAAGYAEETSFSQAFLGRITSSHS